MVERCAESVLKWSSDQEGCIEIGECAHWMQEIVESNLVAAETPVAAVVQLFARRHGWVIR